MTKRRLLLAVAVLATGTTGCSSVSRPNWFHPGPALVQQSRAEQFDPYPENEPGPRIVGSRPREYQKPVPEALRAQQRPWPWRW